MTLLVSEGTTSSLLRSSDKEIVHLNLVQACEEHTVCVLEYLYHSMHT